MKIDIVAWPQTHISNTITKVMLILQIFPLNLISMTSQLKWLKWVSIVPCKYKKTYLYTLFLEDTKFTPQFQVKLVFSGNFPPSPTSEINADQSKPISTMTLYWKYSCSWVTLWSKWSRSGWRERHVFHAWEKSFSATAGRTWKCVLHCYRQPFQNHAETHFRLKPGLKIMR